MSSRERQLLLLGVLIVAFAVLLGRQLVPGLAGGAGPGPGRRVAGAADGAADDAGEVAVLRLGKLRHKPATYRPGRDPFRFDLQPAAPSPPPPRPAPAVEQPAAPPTPQPATPPRPQPPAIDFVYLGSFGVPGREIAVFSDGKEIFNAFAGDVLRQSFVVRSIGYESADVGFVDFPEAPAKRLAVGG